MITLASLTALLKAGPAALAALLAAGATWALAHLAGKREERRMQDDCAKAIATNHAVEQAESSAVTDKEADDALDAAAHADRT
jgi:hypothetical protein